MKNIQIHTQWITAGQLLKLTDHIDSGGQAKQFLEEIPVFLNGERITQRGKKIRPGDVVEINKEKYSLTNR